MIRVSSLQGSQIHCPECYSVWPFHRLCSLLKLLGRDKSWSEKFDQWCMKIAFKSAEMSEFFFISFKLSLVSL